MGVSRPTDRPDVDQGWAWIAMAGAFVNMVCITVMSYSLGIIQVILLDVFDGKVSTVTWIMGLVLAMLPGIGPLAGYLSNAYGCRRIMIVGCFLMTLGLTSCAFVTEISHLFVTLSLITGGGAGLLYTPTFVLLGYYFDKYVGLATCVAATGGGIGVILSASYTNAMQEVYGWRGMFLMMAALCGQCFVSTALCRPNTVEKNFLLRQKLHGLRKSGRTASERAPLTNKGNSSKRTRAYSRSVIDKVELGRDDKRRVSRNNSIEASTTGDALMLSESMVIVATRLDSIEPKQLPSGMKQLSADLRAICNGSMIVYFTSVILWGMSVMSLQLHLQNFVVVKGLSQDESALLTTPMGITNIASRLLPGFLINSGWVNQFVIFFVSLTLMSVTALIFPFLETTFGMSMAYAALFGLSAGGPYAIQSTMVKDLVGLRHLAVGFGLGMLMVGLGALFGPAIAGFLFESTGEYAWTFIFAGTTSAVSASLALILVICRKSYVPLDETSVPPEA